MNFLLLGVLTLAGLHCSEAQANCAAVRCSTNVCGEGESTYLPEGGCCQICVPNTRECEISGQKFSKCASVCSATCEDPNPICNKMCVPRCKCPAGQVVDTRFKKCVLVGSCPPRTCFLPRIIGPCEESFPRFFHNVTSRKCDKFMYGGCGGNKNNFWSKESCEGACKVNDTCSDILGQEFYKCASACPATCQEPNPTCNKRCVPTCTCPAGQVVDNHKRKCVPRESCPATACFLPRIIGPCEASYPRFFHNVTSRKCENFTYGGCGGNINNFWSKESCEGVCKVNDTCSDILGQEFYKCASACPATCQEPNPTCNKRCMPICRCPAGQVVDTHKRKCVPRESCPATACFLPRIIGPCKASFPRFFHNVTSKKCENFKYGGCRGNKNNFWSKESCEGVCKVNNTCTNIQGQKFSNCASACPATCEEPNPICTKECVPRCRCPTGKVVDTDRKKCVHIGRCPLRG